MTPPKPPARAEARVPVWRYLKLFRRDILSAQPARLYHARMAEYRAPFLRSFLVNEPALVRRVLKGVPGDGHGNDLEAWRQATAKARVQKLLGPSTN